MIPAESEKRDEGTEAMTDALTTTSAKRKRHLRWRLGICDPPVGTINPKPLTDVERALRRQMEGR